MICPKESFLSRTIPKCLCESLEQMILLSNVVVFFGCFFCVFFSIEKNKCTKLDKNTTVYKDSTPYLYLNSSKSRADENNIIRNENTQK